MSYLPNPATKQTHTAESIQDWLVGQVSEQLGLNPGDINVREPLDSYGLESMQVMLIASKAERLLGIKISLILLLHYPTIAALSQRIVEDLEDSDLETFQL
jgi:acyl carrier protein